MDKNPSELFLEYATEIGRTGGAAVLSFAQDPIFTSTIGFVRGVFIFASIILVALVVLLFIRANVFSGWKRKHYDWYKPVKPNSKAAKIAGIWKGIIGKLETSSRPNDWRQAVVTADNLLFLVLDEVGFVGETLSQKLDYVTPAEIRNLGDVIPAHRDAFFLGQNPEAEISQTRAAELVKIYGFALKDLGVIS